MVGSQGSADFREEASGAVAVASPAGASSGEEVQDSPAADSRAVDSGAMAGFPVDSAASLAVTAAGFPVEGLADSREDSEEAEASGEAVASADSAGSPVAPVAAEVEAGTPAGRVSVGVTF